MHIKKISIIKIILIFIVISFFAVWAFPIKLTLFEDKQIEKYILQGDTVLICHIDQITGPLWKIEKRYNTENQESHINIEGNMPDLYLKYPIYCYNSDFVFIGEFIDKNTFNIKEWKTFGWIFREYELNPVYPPYGFNIFEIRW